MPAKIVIGVDSVPATVMGLERVMCPANTGIRTGNHDSLPLEPERPNIRRVRVSDPRLDRRRPRRAAGPQRRLLDRTSLRKVIVNKRIAGNTRHVWTSSQRRGDLPSAFYQDGINDIERLMFDVAHAQPFKDRPLGGLGVFQQGLINEAALFRFSWQIGCRTQISLICEQDKKFSLLSVGSVIHYPRRDFARRIESVPSRIDLNCRCPWLGRGFA